MVKFQGLKKRGKRYGKRMQTPSILRPLKSPFTDGQQIVKICHYLELQSLQDYSRGQICIGGDGYFRSNGRAIGQNFQFTPWENASFDKMGQSYQQYTIVGLKVDVTPASWLQQGLLDFTFVQPYFGALCKGTNDFVTGTIDDITDDFLMMQDRPKMYLPMETSKMYCKYGYYIDQACVKKYRRTSGGVNGVTREMFAGTVNANPGTLTVTDEVPFICYSHDSPGDNAYCASYKVTVYYIFTNKVI